MLENRHLIVFSRNERTHSNFVSQGREIEIFCKDCKLAASFFGGFGPRFRVHLSRHAWLSTFWGFFDLGFDTSDWIRLKRNAGPIQTGMSLLCQAKTTCIVAKHVYTTRFASYSGQIFVLMFVLLAQNTRCNTNISLKKQPLCLNITSEVKMRRFNSMNWRVLWLYRS